MNRMKGMHGVCLRPGARIELKARLYNRTPLVQTFLWWANVATRVHEHYQSFFPPDVHYVADHAKRAMSTFPLCTGPYYGVDYAARGRTGVPAWKCRDIRPAGRLSAERSYLVREYPRADQLHGMGRPKDFFGGYDHARKPASSTLPHHISPGKKQWTGATTNSVMRGTAT